MNEQQTKTNIIKQIKSDMDYMHNKTYKLNGQDSYTPVWNLMLNIADAFDLDFDEYNGGEYEDTEEVLEDLDDVIDADAKVLGYHPTYADITDAEDERKYISNMYSDNEILDTYNFKKPRPLTTKDIKVLFKNFKKALDKKHFTPKMIKYYQHRIMNTGISDWA